MVMGKGIKTNVKRDGEFIPPDGGWGWAIIFAAGFSNLSALPVLQQFGLLFRDKFERLGISSSQTTTIMNMNSALTSCVGLANGPMFKTFTYRQVSLTGATLVFVSLMLTTFSCNFITYLLSFSVMYGASYGISSSANALALNTYWKNRRRLATSLSWTTTGLGPILWPHLITALFYSFGETGTILILCGISLHAIACALLLQPVEWHVKGSTKENKVEKLIEFDFKAKRLEKKLESGYFSAKLKNLSAFSSQYLYNEDDEVNPRYEITDPGIPMMLRANDGYFSQPKSRSIVSSRDGSTKTSRLNSKKPSMTNLLDNRSRKSSTLYLNELKKNSAVNLGALAQERDTYKPKRTTSITLKTLIPESDTEDCPTLKAPQDLKSEEKTVAEKKYPTDGKICNGGSEKCVTDNTTKSLKTFKTSNCYDEKYNNDNCSNISFKKLSQHDEIYKRDSQNKPSIRNHQYGNIYYKDNHYNAPHKHHEDVEEKKYMKDNMSNQSVRTRYRRKSNNFNYESEVLKEASLKLEEYLKEKEDKRNTVMKPLLEKIYDDDACEEKKIDGKDEDEKENNESLTFWQKVALFFDLDLLRDFTFINLMLGINLANFNELNFSLLTPFILGDCGKTKSEVALFMSLLAGVDICVRFCIPFVAGKIGWDNNSFFLFGVMSMAMGRVVLAFSQESWVVTLVAVIIGFGKGLRTVFMALVIPTHVPLHKLPGATGIQLLTAGIMYLSLGPVVGWIKDNASTAVTLHSLNIFTWLTALSWGLEKHIRARRQGESDENFC